MSFLRPLILASSTVAAGFIVFLPDLVEVGFGDASQEQDALVRTDMTSHTIETRQLPEAMVAPQRKQGAASPPPSFASPADRETARPDGRPARRVDSEAYPEAEANPVRLVSEAPVSTFSSDPDTASYAVVRSSLNRGRMPPEDAVRVEEMINYFPYAYPTPDGAHPFEPTVSVTPTPWNEGTRLLHIGIQGEVAQQGDQRRKLVFLVDTSGSMRSADKLPLLKSSFRLLLDTLDPRDEVAIVTYAGSSGVALEPTPVSERAAILTSLENLRSGGGTAGQAGLVRAYSVAEAMKEEGDLSRVILATDGDFNIGIHDPEELESYISGKRETGTYLSVLGFGRGNLDEQVMQSLAQNGNGTAAFIDTLNEARKVLVEQAAARIPIADDLKLQVEFNPARVAEYRLIGYETRQLAREDFSNDKVDAGDIGSGYSMTAIYEITAPDSPARRIAPSRYAAPEPAGAQMSGEMADEVAFLRLRYKAPGADDSTLIETPVPDRTAEPGQEAAFSIAIAGFGQLLADSKYTGDWDWQDAMDLARENKGEDVFGYRSEAIRMMGLARSLDD